MCYYYHYRQYHHPLIFLLSLLQPSLLTSDAMCFNSYYCRRYIHSVLFSLLPLLSSLLPLNHILIISRAIIIITNYFFYYIRFFITSIMTTQSHIRKAVKFPKCGRVECTLRKKSLLVTFHFVEFL